MGAPAGHRAGIRLGWLVASGNTPRSDSLDQRHQWQLATAIFLASLKDLYATDAQGSGIAGHGTYRWDDSRAGDLVPEVGASPRERNFSAAAQASAAAVAGHPQDYVLSIVAAAGNVAETLFYPVSSSTTRSADRCPRDWRGFSSFHLSSGDLDGLGPLETNMVRQVPPLSPPCLRAAAIRGDPRRAQGLL